MSSLISAGIAIADNVVNDVTIEGIDTFTAGGSTTVGYKIVDTNGDGQKECNASDSTPATVTIIAPTQVTASPNSLTFTECKVTQNVTFSSNTPGNYPITVSVSDSGPGSYHITPAEFTLHVLAPTAPSDTTLPVITYSISGTSGSNNWYTSDVTVTWSVTDPESAVTIDS